MNSVYTHVATPILAAVVTNGIVFSQKLPISKTKNPNIPPGGVVGLVWMVLFGLLGYVHFKLYMKAGSTLSDGCIIILLFLLYSLAYPFLTSSSGNPNVFFVLNLGALLFAVAVTAKVYQEDPRLVPYLIPLLLWTGYVNLVTA
jgi:tryptophan-rich sensory protein